MIEQIEKLSIDAKPGSFAKREPLCQIHVAPREIRTAKGIAPEISKLTVLRSVSAVAGSRARIDGRDKCVRIQPLNRARLGDARNRVVFVQRHARNNTRELWTTPVDYAVSIGRIGRAHH